MENRIKEQFSLFADRVSAETMRANQLRLYLSTMAYVLVSALRRLCLKATELARAQVSTIRTKLLNIGAQIRVTVRKVGVSMASSYPLQQLYQQNRRTGHTLKRFHLRPSLHHGWESARDGRRVPDNRAAIVLPRGTAPCAGFSTSLRMPRWRSRTRIFRLSSTDCAHDSAMRRRSGRLRTASAG